MGLLDRSKVRLTCTVDAVGYQPGDLLTGQVHLDVKSPMCFSALRLHVLGRESAEVFVQHGVTMMVTTAETDYLNSWTTFTGPSKRSHCRATQVYQPGCYTFPFTIPLGVHLPPSFTVTSNSGSVQLKYAATAILTIPGGFDAYSEAPFTVEASAPLWQYQQLAMGGTAAQRFSLMYRWKVFGILCHRPKSALVHIKISAIPGILCLGTDQCTVRVTITNNGTAAITEIKSHLYNVVHIHHDLHESFATNLVGKATARNLSIAPGTTETVEMPLQLMVDRFRTSYNQSTRRPLPSFRTSMVTSGYVFQIKFPKNAMERVPFYGAVNVVKSTTTNAGAFEVPRRFPGTQVHASDLRYITNPTDIQLPAFNVRNEDAPTPYLPRTLSHDGGSEVGFEVHDEGDTDADDTVTNMVTAAEEPVLATAVLHQRIIEATIAEDNQAPYCQ